MLKSLVEDESLKDIIEETESGAVYTFISSVYDDIVSRIDEYKMEASIYVIGLLSYLLLF